MFHIGFVTDNLVFSLMFTVVLLLLLLLFCEYMCMEFAGTGSAFLLLRWVVLVVERAVEDLNA